MPKNKKTSPTLNGKLVRLRLIDKDDIELLRKWRNKNRKYFFDQSFITKKKQNDWFKSYQKNNNDLLFIIETLDGEPVGTISLYNIDLTKKQAEYGRMLIADLKHRGKGYAKDATRVLLDHAFHSLKIREVRLEIFKENLRGQKFYEKFGFIKKRKNSSSDRISMSLDKKIHSQTKRTKARR